MAAATITRNAVAGGELIELGAGICGDPLLRPVAAVVVKVVPEVEIPKVSTIGVESLEIGKIEQDASVAPP